MTGNDRITNKQLYHEIKDLKRYFEEHYVTRVEFRPVKAFVYGIITVTLLAVMTALVAQVVIAR